MPHPGRMILQASALALSVFFAGVALSLSLRFGLFWYLEPASRIPGDFQVYWVAAERLSAGLPIYQPTDTSPFKYSPTFAYLFRWCLFSLNQKLAAAVWMAASVLAFFGALLVLGSRLVARAGNPGQLVGAAVVAIALSWHAILETLSYGQVDLSLGAALVVILLPATGGQRDRSNGSKALRALLWGLILMVKPHLALVLASACVAFGWREGLRAAIATSAFLVLPALWLGPARLMALFGEWWNCLRVQQDAAFMTGNINQSLAAVLTRLMDRPQEFGALSALAVLAYLALISLFRPVLRRRWGARGGISPETKLALLACGLCGHLVFSPLSWRWGVFLWIPIVAIVASLQRSPLKLLPWLVLATACVGPIASWLGLGRDDQVSFLGLSCWASLALLWPLLAALGNRPTANPTKPT